MSGGGGGGRGSRMIRTGNGTGWGGGGSGSDMEERMVTKPDFMIADQAVVGSWDVLADRSTRWETRKSR